MARKRVDDYTFDREAHSKANPGGGDGLGIKNRVTAEQFATEFAAATGRDINAVRAEAGLPPLPEGFRRLPDSLATAGDGAPDRSDYRPGSEEGVRDVGWAEGALSDAGPTAPSAGPRTASRC